jgi:hypothetical protein
MQERIMFTLQTRLLWPFFFDRHAHHAAVEALLALPFAMRKGDKKVWIQHQEIPHFYRDEFLPIVPEFLFGEQGIQYFSLNPDLKESWFGRGLEAHYQKNTFKVALEQHAALEVFILPEGVGILSFTFQHQQDNEDEAALKLFNYRLSQAIPAKAPHLGKPVNQHPDAPPKPAEDALLAERLGQAGGVFSLPELTTFLLQPLQAFNLHTPQQQFSVYSVLRLHRDIDLGQERARWLPLLTALTHVEEIAHAGSLELTQKQLNTRHWTAVGSLGAAHFICDQSAEVRFNEERQLVNLMKYFMDFWAALAQRLILQRTLREGLRIVRDVEKNEADKYKRLQNLHGEMLEFMLAGYFTEVSSREAHNQYYSLARQGLRVEQNFETVRRALHDADIKSNAAFQASSLEKQCVIQEDQDKHLHEMKTMQSKLEWLEIFFASYYAGALSYYIAGKLFKPEYVSASVFVWALIAGGLAAYVLQPWQHHGAAHTENTATPHKPRSSSWLWIALGILALLIAGWVGLGLECCPYKKNY